MGKLIIGNFLICIVSYNIIPPFYSFSIVSTVTALSTLCILCVSVYLIHERKPLSLITIHKKPEWENIIKGGSIWLLIVTLTILLLSILIPTSYTFTYNFNIGFILVSLVSISLYAFTEEIIFHGYLLQGFSLINQNPKFLLLITSFIFGILHYFNGTTFIASFVTVFSCFLFSLVLGWIVLVEGCLETAVGIHISNNLFGTLVCVNPVNIYEKTTSMIIIHTNHVSPLLNYTNLLLLIVLQLILLVMLFILKYK